MSRTSPLGRDERGMALGLAIFALALIGGMIGLNFLSALLEQQGGRNVRMAGQLAEAADGALWELMPQVEPDRLLLLPPGGTALDLGSVSPQAGLVIQRRI